MTDVDPFVQVEEGSGQCKQIIGRSAPCVTFTHRYGKLLYRFFPDSECFLFQSKLLPWRRP